MTDNVTAEKIKREEAFKLVYDELMKHSLFTGIYDATHGSQEFIDGVGVVMEVIACNVSEDTYISFTDIWTKNVLESEEKKHFKSKRAEDKQ